MLFDRDRYDILMEFAIMIDVGKGMFALISILDADKVLPHRWTVKRKSSRWYAVTKITDRNTVHYVTMHRLITNAPPEMDVHHRNGWTLDNRRSNLQIVTPQHHKTIHVAR